VTQEPSAADLTCPQERSTVHSFPTSCADPQQKKPFRAITCCFQGIATSKRQHAALPPSTLYKMTAFCRSLKGLLLLREECLTGLFTARWDAAEPAAEVLCSPVPPQPQFAPWALAGVRGRGAGQGSSAQEPHSPWLPSPCHHTVPAAAGEVSPAAPVPPPWALAGCSRCTALLNRFYFQNRLHWAPCSVAGETRFRNTIIIVRGTPALPVSTGVRHPAAMIQGICRGTFYEFH